MGWSERNGTEQATISDHAGQGGTKNGRKGKRVSTVKERMKELERPEEGEKN